MKNSIFPLVFFALLGLFLSSAIVSYASPSSSDEVPFCLPFDYERERGTTYAAGKLADLDVGEPRTVRMIYFLPNNRPFRTSVIDSMKTTIRQVQTFYAEQMQAHSLGNKTFRFETDAEGEPWFTAWMESIPIATILTAQSILCLTRFHRRLMSARTFTSSLLI